MKKPLPLAFLAAVLLFLGWIHFSNLEWGLPSKERNLQVFGSLEEMRKWVPAMIEQRKKYYEMREKLLDENQPFKEAYANLSQRWNIPYFETIPKDIILDRIRNYVIGANVSDEQLTMTALSAIKPQKFQLVPGNTGYYGGFYFYSAGAFLVLGKLAGWVTLAPAVEYYFDHPEEVSRMFQLVRALGGVSILLTASLLFFMMMRFYDFKSAVLASLFFAFTPLMVPYSHLIKAHLYGMFWCAAGLYFCGLILKSPEGEIRNYVSAGVSLGFCFAAINMNVLAGSLLFFTECLRREWRIGKVLKSRNLWIAVFLFSLVFFATNFYVFTRFSEYHRYSSAMKVYSAARMHYFEIYVKAWLPYLKEFCNQNIHWAALPLLGAGIWDGIRRKDKFMTLCALSFAVLFLTNLAVIRHAPVNCRLLPFLAVLCAGGAHRLLSAPGGWKIPAFAYVALALFLSAIQSVHFSKLHKNPSNLDLAGAWVNGNVSLGSSIGAWGGGFSTFDFPALRFLEYKMTALPHIEELDSRNPDLAKMPDVLIVSEGVADDTTRDWNWHKSLFLEKNYKLIHELEREKKFFGIEFDSSLIKTGNQGVRILKKI